MKASKAIALLGLAALAVLTFNYGLKVATDSLLVGEREEVAALAQAPAPPAKILASATATPEAAPDLVESATDRPFGTPDPDFGQANPAQGEPAWGAAELARQAETAAAAAQAEISAN
jgi:hypothetical protein